MTAQREQIREAPPMVDFDIGRPQKVMTKQEYSEWGIKRPHIVMLDYDNAGNVAYWFLDPVLGAEFERGKGIGMMIGWAQAKQDSAKMLDGIIEAKPRIEYVTKAEKS